jgi:predicted DNA-binding protein
MAATRLKNLHVPLSPGLHEQLRREAARTGKPATELAREAIEASLAERQRTALAESIAVYAAAVAGTRDDLDPALERAGVEHLSGRRRRS